MAEIMKCDLCGGEATWLEKSQNVPFCDKHKIWYHYEYQPNLPSEPTFRRLVKTVQRIQLHLEQLARWEQEKKIEIEDILEPSLVIYEIQLLDWTIEDEFLKFGYRIKWTKDEYDCAGVEWVRLKPKAISQ